MEIAFTIPIWLIAILIIFLGIGVGFSLPTQGSYDMFTPLFTVLIIIASFTLSIGLVLGKYVF